MSNAANGKSAEVFVGTDGSDTSPRAYLNYILFDRDFDYEDADFDQVGSTSTTASGPQAINRSVTIEKKGYIYVYVSNESNNSFDVYFDDLRIVHRKGKILQEDHYYPFGLSINALSSSAPLSTPNNFKYNGKEEQTDFDLGWYDYGARMYNSSLGRWHNVDPLGDKYTNLSPYNYVMNNPANAIDPDGRLVVFIGGLRLWVGRFDQRPNASPQSGGLPSIYDEDVYEYWSTDENSWGVDASIDGYFMDDIFDDPKAVYLSGSSSWRSQADTRAAEGRKKGELFHKHVQQGRIKLDDGETIKIVAHSQGGAHSVGFANQLMSYKDENGDPIYKVEVIVYITPHQPTDITHPDGPIGIQFSHPSDKISSKNRTPNGGSEYGPINNIYYFYGQDIFGGTGQPGLGSVMGKRGGHNVTDNIFFIMSSMVNDFCKNNPDRCSINDGKDD